LGGKTSREQEEKKVQKTTVTPEHSDIKEEGKEKKTRKKIRREKQKTPFTRADRGD